jgi:hypothetical protein
MTLLTIDLRAEAAAEAGRLAAARALARGRDTGDDTGDDPALAQLEADAAWIMTARAPALRRALGGRALLLWRVACEDAQGRIVDSRLVAVAVALSGGAPLRRRAHVEALLDAVEREAVEAVDRCSDDWRLEVERGARAFAATRAARERALGADAPLVDLFQPGLFDRRANRGAGPAAGRFQEMAPAAVARPRLRLVVVP